MKPIFTLKKSISFGAFDVVARGASAIFVGFDFMPHSTGFSEKDIKHLFTFLNTNGKEDRQIIALEHLVPINADATKILELNKELAAAWQILRSEIVDRFATEIDEYNKQIKGSE